MSLAVVEPSSLVQVDEQCTSIEVWAEQPDRTIAELRDAGHKLAAIDEYLARTSTEGRARVAATQRRLEVRIGVLLGPASPNGKGSGSIAIDPSEALSKDERSAFRKMAEHPDVVDDVIASSTDEQPASRRKVVDKIKEIVRNEVDKAAAAREDKKALADVAAGAAATGWDMDEDRQAARGAFARLCRDLVALGTPRTFLADQDQYLRDRHWSGARAAHQWLGELLDVKGDR